MSCCLCCPIRCQWKDKPSNLCGLLAGFLNPKLSTLFQDYEYEMLMHGSPRAALRIWLWTAIGKEENVPCQYSSVSCEEDIEERCQSRCCICMNRCTQNTLSLTAHVQSSVSNKPAHTRLRKTRPLTRSLEPETLLGVSQNSVLTTRKSTWFLCGTFHSS